MNSDKEFEHSLRFKIDTSSLKKLGITSSLLYNDPSTFRYVVRKTIPKFREKVFLKILRHWGCIIKQRAAKMV